MGSFHDILLAYRDLIAFAVSTLMLVILLWRFWDRVSFWFLNLVYSFPVIGKISRLKNDRNQQDGWFKGEKTLCADYYRHVRVKSENEFAECQAYQRKAGDLGRHPFPLLMWLLIIVLVYVEAMGFSYVLAGMTVPGASENVQQQAAVGIAFMISVILVAFTHFAGHEMYKSNVIRRARQTWDEEDKPGRLSTRTIGLLEKGIPQSIDDDEPEYTQVANRVGTHPYYWLTVATVLIVVFVAVGATYVRMQVLEKELIQETTTGTAANPYYNAPAELAAPQKQAQQRAAEESVGHTRSAGWGTFIVLAVIFVFLQLLGMIFGWKWGFAGKHSAKAYKLCGGDKFDTYGDFKNHYYDRIADVAQAKLEVLQQLIQRKNSEGGNRGIACTKTFTDYVLEFKGNDKSTASQPQPVPNAQTPLTGVPVNKSTVAEATESAKRYHYATAANQPSSESVTLEELETLCQDGAISESAYVIEQGGAQWITFGNLRPKPAVPEFPPIPGALPPIPSGAG